MVNTSAGEEFSNEVFRQKLDGGFNLKLGTTANLKVTMNGGLKNKTSNSGTFSSLLLNREDSAALLKETKNFRYLSEESKEQRFMISGLYLKKLKKAGRTFTVGLMTSLEQLQMNAQLKSNTRVSKSELDNENEDIEQDKNTAVSNQGLYMNATYSEPVSKSLLGKTAIFEEGLSRMILNASISKVFCKENALKISLSGSDLLNQNVGFTRNTSGNLISQQRFTVIKRYFMLALTYDLNKMTAQ
ncbi:hypothetical protein H9X96_20275 [Pedobacter sp. N36a]|uniref:hypothetical protein n=1 Tax=Pedobacter sp. N36a TaxID=2767996 RepID=UPI001656EFF3|nr:hypothetical protein [Pedobacter sp. N36a]MBC8988097.1 hypothetical protein [Pedobacter sp. N36a]